MSDIAKKQKIITDNKPDENQEEQGEGVNKKINQNYDSELSKKQESRMMNFFNQEFLDRKIDFKPK
jgi:hypothetical protein